MLRTQADAQGLSWLHRPVKGDRLFGTDIEDDRASVRTADRGQEIHGRRSNEAGHELVSRPVIKLKRTALFLDDALTNDDNMLRLCHRSPLIGRNKARGGAQPI